MEKELIRRLQYLDRGSQAKMKLRTKMTLIILITVLVTAAACLTTVRYFSGKLVRKGYARIGMNACLILDTQLDAQRVRTWFEALKAGEDPGEGYFAADAALRYIQSSCSLDCLYIACPAEDAVYYLMASDTDPGIMLPFNKEDLYDEEKAAFYEGGTIETEIVEDEGIFTFTVWKPVLDADGTAAAWIGADMSLKTLQQEANSFLYQIIIVLLIVVAVLTIVMVAIVSATIVAPIMLLNLAASDLTARMIRAESLQSVTAGTDPSKMEGQRVFESLPIRSIDEIGDLHRSLIQMEKSSHRFFVNMLLATREKERMGAELSVAKQIQEDMLPTIFPPFPERSEFDIYATMVPAREVGGDFYDFFFVDEDHLALVMADVSGKGIPAALFMVIAKTLIKNRAQMDANLSPAAILQEVNEQLCEGNEAEQFVTVWLAVLEISTGKGLAANAGHEHPAIRRAGGTFELAVYPHSPAVAAMEGMRFKEHAFQLFPGDTLYVYTDGVAEATNADDQLFGTDRMLKALNREPDASPEKLLSNVRHAMDEFVLEAAQFDDITMLSLKYFGSKSASEQEEL